MESWAEGEWFTRRDDVPDSIKMVVFKVTGETNTDDLSPAPDAWSRPDIPLHALAMFKMARDGIEPDQAGVTGPLKQIQEIKRKGLPVAFVGDVVVQALPGSPPRIQCSGISEKTRPAFPINAQAACALEAKSLQSSITRWKMRVRWSLRHPWTN